MQSPSAWIAGSLLRRLAASTSMPPARVSKDRPALRASRSRGLPLVPA
jgi:hypothetical protein